MRPRLWFGLAAVAALWVASAQAAPQVILRVNVPFEFVAEGRTLPAGTYEVMEQSPTLVELRAANGTPAARALVTRLAASEVAAATDEAIFDEVGSENVLSEIWRSGEDGYLVAATKAPHTHVRVKGSKK
jgi:hypothetical protein